MRFVGNSIMPGIAATFSAKSPSMTGSSVEYLVHHANTPGLNAALCL